MAVVLVEGFGILFLFFFNISDPERPLIGCRSLIMNDHHEALQNIATHSRSVSLFVCGVVLLVCGR
jgi:hypothetical protein